MVLNRCAAIGTLEARGAEVDFDRRLWTLPPERMKSAKQHVVPLSTAALAVLDRQQEESTPAMAVFPGRSGAPLSYASFATAPAKAGIGTCTPHGWRRMTEVERRREVMTRYADWLERRARQGPRLPHRQDRLSCSSADEE